MIANIFCDTQAVEDEVHFLLHCGLYNHIRENVFQDLLLNDVFMNNNFEGKIMYLIQIFSRKVAKYLVQAYLKRRNVIYILTNLRIDHVQSFYHAIQSDYNYVIM